MTIFFSYLLKTYLSIVEDSEPNSQQHVTHSGYGDFPGNDLSLPFFISSKLSGAVWYKIKKEIRLAFSVGLCECICVWELRVSIAATK